MRGELDVLAALVHAAASTIHGYGAVRGVLPPQLRGAVKGAHALAFVYNALRGQWEDAGAHVLGVLSADCGNRAVHAGLAVYDGAATIAHVKGVLNDNR